MSGVMRLGCLGCAAASRFVDAGFTCGWGLTTKFISMHRALVDKVTLLEAIRAVSLVGAMYDVFAEDPLPSDHPFWTMKMSDHTTPR
jgi:hypothetical protein